MFDVHQSLIFDQTGRFWGRQLGCSLIGLRLKVTSVE